MVRDLNIIDREALIGALKAIEHSAGSPRGQMVGFTMEQVDALKQLLKHGIHEQSGLKNGEVTDV